MDTISELYRLLNERPFRHILAKQKNIGQLFPTFPARVAAIDTAELYEETPGLWHFKVSAVTTPNVDFWDVYVQFRDIALKIREYGKRHNQWKSDGSGIDLDKLANRILTNADMRVWCSCPCNQFWGFAYIQTTHQTKYGDPENRKPRVRNPDQRGTGCKHLQKVFDKLPSLKSTLAGHLKRFFSDDIKAIEKEVFHEKAKFKAAADVLRKKEREKQEPISYTRGGRAVKR